MSERYTEAEAAYCMEVWADHLVANNHDVALASLSAPALLGRVLRTNDADAQAILRTAEEFAAKHIDDPDDEAGGCLLSFLAGNCSHWFAPNGACELCGHEVRDDD